MDPTESPPTLILPITCNSSRAKNCCSVSFDFNLQKQAFEIKAAGTILVVPFDDFPGLRQRILTVDKPQRLILRRTIERLIGQALPMLVEDLELKQLPKSILIRNKAANKNWLIPTTCGCVRNYLLFQLSLLIAKLDDFDTKIFSALSKITQ